MLKMPTRTPVPDVVRRALTRHAATLACAVASTFASDVATAQRASQVAASPLSRVTRERAAAFSGRAQRNDLVVADVSAFAQDETGVGTYWPGGPRTPLAPPFAFPAGARPPSEQDAARYASEAGDPFDGVARLVVRDGAGNVLAGCTGALIGDRRLLTAAHCVAADAESIVAGQIDATFLGAGGPTTIAARAIHVMPGYTGSVVDTRDLAVVELARDADPWIPRYPLFGGNPLFTPMLQVGYGLTGNGITGGVVNTLFDAEPTRRVAWQRWELSGDDAFVYAGDAPGGAILFADFDGGNGATLRFPVRGGWWDVGTPDDNNYNCAFGAALFPDLDPALLGAVCSDTYFTTLPPHVGYDEFEGVIDAGDSGGPAFVVVDGVWQLAAVASFGDYFCVPDQRLDARTALPAPRTDPACRAAGYPAGYVTVSGLFGTQTGHVFVGAGEQRAFVSASLGAASPVPEPRASLLLGSALLMIGLHRRRFRRCPAPPLPSCAT